MGPTDKEHAGRGDALLLGGHRPRPPRSSFRLLVRSEVKGGSDRAVEGHGGLRGEHVGVEVGVSGLRSGPVNPRHGAPRSLRTSPSLNNQGWRAQRPPDATPARPGTWQFAGVCLLQIRRKPHETGV